MTCEIAKIDCIEFLQKYNGNNFDLTFLDPPFNQSKEYRSYDDDIAPHKYWNWMKNICELIFHKSSDGSSIYFMQREKNTEQVLNVLQSAGWTFQNLIIWKKMTSAVPSEIRFGKQYQIIVFATKGKRARVFNRIRIDPPLLETQKYRRPNGVYVTDIWDDIRELTSGYFSGDEPFRDENGERVHKQQSPIHLLTRIILSSTKVSDLVFDPFAGTGTTLIASKQLQRNSIGTEIDNINFEIIKKRIQNLRPTDNIRKLYSYYRFTENLSGLWPDNENVKFINENPIQLKMI
ncbi:MAG TPA: modification methylase [Anaerolineaceae bacterium]|nr:modification methylase [Anaerolineaceae bacterium]